MNRNSDITHGWIARFFRTIDPIADAYISDTFSFVAVRHDDQWILVRGTLYLNVGPSKIPLKYLRTEDIFAGHFKLADAGLHRQELVESLCRGNLQTPEGKLVFPPRDNVPYGARFEAFHEGGKASQSRWASLALLGQDSDQFVVQPDLDWKIRSSFEPYDGMADVLVSFKPGSIEQTCVVELLAFNVAAIDNNSHVSGETAHLKIIAALAAKAERVSVGIRVIENGAVTERRTLSGLNVRWTAENGMANGTCQHAVPRAAVVHAIVKYNGIAQHHFYFGDPSTFQNYRRAAYETFDANCAQLRDILEKAQANRPAQRQFEDALHWLFWMLGLSPAHIGNLGGEAADILLGTPSGNLAIVECTVGILKEESKLAKLHARTEAMRKKLALANGAHINVLPIISTAKARVDVQPELEQARAMGIYVLTRDEIETMLVRTLLVGDPEQFYEEARRSLSP